MFIPAQRPERKKPNKRQKTAIEASLHTLREEPRAHIVSPCGTGKTLIAARILEELAASGHARRRLVLLPTLDLLIQTIRAFQADSRHMGEVMAVCGPLDALSELGVPRAANAGELAEMLDGDHYTVFATYAHLVDSGDFHGTIITAHQQGTIPPWDLIFCDEAHRTAGSVDKAWAVVHDDDVIPAARRFYCTATPRIWSADPKYAETLAPREGALYLVASMDDPAVYGPRVFSMQLSEGIAEGLARDYRIVLVEVDHPTLQPQLRRTRTATATDAVALMSLATATVKTCAAYDTRRMITFHRAIADATAFIKTFNATCDALAGDTTTNAHGTTVPLQPPSWWARATYGEDPHRYTTVDTFRADPPPAHLSILANSRLMGEGMDFPTVDALCFAAPKSSVTDIVQALGRALRLHPHNTDKATILVPIYLRPGEDPKDLLNANAYQPLYDILLALRAHDLRIQDRVPATKLTRQPDDEAAAAVPGKEPALPEQPAEPTVELAPDAGPPPFGAAGPPEIVGTNGITLTPRQIADVLQLRVFKPQGATREWMVMAKAAMDFHTEHGHLAVTRAQAAALATDPHHVDLYTWLANQRTARRNEELQPWQISLLNNHGMPWNPAEENRETFITYAEECARECGGLAVSVGYTAPDGHKVGRALANYRQAAKNFKMNPRLMAELTRIDPHWNPAWDFSWQGYYQQARHRHTQGRPLTQPGDGRAYRTWLRDPGPDLSIDQEALLREIGLHPSPAQP